MKKLDLEDEIKKGFIFVICGFQISYVDGFLLEQFEYEENGIEYYSVVDTYDSLIEAIYQIQSN